MLLRRAATTSQSSQRPEHRRPGIHQPFSSAGTGATKHGGKPCPGSARLDSQGRQSSDRRLHLPMPFLLGRFAAPDLALRQSCLRRMQRALTLGFEHLIRPSTYSGASANTRSGFLSLEGADPLNEAAEPMEHVSWGPCARRRLRCVWAWQWPVRTEADASVPGTVTNILDLSVFR